MAFLEPGTERWVVQRELVPGLFPGECGEWCGEATAGESLAFIHGVSPRIDTWQLDQVLQRENQTLGFQKSLFPPLPLLSNTTFPAVLLFSDLWDVGQVSSFLKELFPILTHF